MARASRGIRIEDWYATKTGAAGGMGCLNTCQGMEVFGIDQVGPVAVAITGKTHKFLRDNSELAGSPIVINIPQMPSSVFSSLKSAINTVQTSNGEATVIFTNGPEGTKSVECKFGTPTDPREFVWDGTFWGDQVFDVSINLTIQTLN